jgi:hypothetical protein
MHRHVFPAVCCTILAVLVSACKTGEQHQFSDVLLTLSAAGEASGDLRYLSQARQLGHGRLMINSLYLDPFLALEKHFIRSYGQHLWAPGSETKLFLNWVSNSPIFSYSKFIIHHGSLWVEFFFLRYQRLTHGLPRPLVVLFTSVHFLVSQSI